MRTLRFEPRRASEIVNPRQLARNCWTGSTLVEDTPRLNQGMSDWARPLMVTSTVFPVPVVVVTCGVVSELGPVVAMNWYAAAVPAAGVDPYAAAVLAPCSAAALARWLAWDHKANWIARRTAKKKAGMQTTNAASPSSPRIRRGPGAP